MSRTRDIPLYGNCIITAPDGQALCRCNQDKIKWYLDRDLGTITSNDPITLRLAFEPKGRKGADHPYTTSFKRNICVVCGIGEEITRHHVVPRCFRRHFPIERKEHVCGDILILCKDCHEAYEYHAYEYKKIISQETGVPIGVGPKSRSSKCFKVIMASHALIRHYDKIPEKRREELLSVLRGFFNKSEITKEDMRNAIDLEADTCDPDFIPFGQQVVEKLDSIDGFVIRWRKHFVETMQPGFLPDHWCVEDLMLR